MASDEYALAACYASFLAAGYVFNDANKRTAFTCMDVCLSLSAIELGYKRAEVGNFSLSQHKVSLMKSN
jgi:death-on-curing protein